MSQSQWKAVLGKGIGTSHIKTNKPCQDYGHYEILDDVFIGAVSDGAGSARLSHIGSETAVKVAITELKQYEWQQSQPLTQQKAKEIFSKVLEEVKSALNKKAQENNCLSKDLACTLLAVVATPKWLAAMQVGDGLIVVGSQGKDDYELLFKPDKGEYVNQTTFVTSSQALKKMQVNVRQNSHNFISISTDWNENIAVNHNKDWKPATKFFEVLKSWLQEMTEEKCKQELNNFLNSKDVNSKTEDDKTLLLAIYQDENLRSSPTNNSKEKESKPSLTNKNQKVNNKNLLLLIWVSLISCLFSLFNLIFLVFLFLFSNINKESNKMFISNIDNRPHPIEFPGHNSEIYVWAIVDNKFLDNQNKTLTLTEANSPLPLYVKIPSFQPVLPGLGQIPLGYLSPGIYPYFEAKYFDEQAQNAQDEDPRRWVKLKVDVDPKEEEESRGWLEF